MKVTKKDKYKVSGPTIGVSNNCGGARSSWKGSESKRTVGRNQLRRTKKVLSNVRLRER